MHQTNNALQNYNTGRENVFSEESQLQPTLFNILGTSWNNCRNTALQDNLHLVLSWFTFPHSLHRICNCQLNNQIWSLGWSIRGFMMCFSGFLEDFCPVHKRTVIKCHTSFTLDRILHPWSLEYWTNTNIRQHQWFFRTESSQCNSTACTIWHKAQWVLSKKVTLNSKGCLLLTDNDSPHKFRSIS